MIDLSRVGSLLFGQSYHHQLADALGVTTRVLIRWERGDMPIPPTVVPEVEELLRRRAEAIAEQRDALAHAYPVFTQC